MSLKETKKKGYQALIAIAVIGIVALPKGILSSGFMEELDDEKEILKKCPSCGVEVKVWDDK